MKNVNSECAIHLYPPLTTNLAAQKQLSPELTRLPTATDCLVGAVDCIYARSRLLSYRSTRLVSTQNQLIEYTLAPRNSEQHSHHIYNSRSLSIMVLKTRHGVTEMRHRQCKCPLNSTQDGVCGCPQFWELNPEHVASTPDIDVIEDNGTGPGFPSSTPPDPPREICFFWYHGNCRRGKQCKLAHESHITWPMSAPPRYMHYDACNLVLCPLRRGLVALEQERKSSPKVDSQVDGAAMDLFSRATPVKVTFSDEESMDIGSDTGFAQVDETEQEPTSLIDPSSRALNGSYSDSSDSESVCPDEEVAVKEPVEPKHRSPLHPHANAVASPPPTADSMNYFDISELAPPPPSSDTDESPLLSLSHAGTLSKRKRTTSPNGVYSDNKRSKQEALSDFGGVPLIMERGCRIDDSDTKPSGGFEYPAAPNTSSAYHAPYLPRKPSPLTTADMSAYGRSTTAFRPGVSIPTGPRALAGDKLICYYWYHKGECTPTGKHSKCLYAHTLNGPHAKVSMPSKTRHHDPNCRLPLCPHRQAQNGNSSRGGRGREVVDTRVKNGPYTSPRHNRKSVKNEPFSSPRRHPLPVKNESFSSPHRGAHPPNHIYSSSPREGIMQGRSSANGQPIGRNRMYANLPKLTGANRQRFKAQKHAIEKWQAENNVKPIDPRKQREEKMELKRMQKRIKMQKRLERKRMEEVSPLLRYEDEDEDSRVGETALPAMPHLQDKAGKNQRRASELFDVNVASGGRTETFDQEAELYKQSFRPTAGFPEHTAVRDSHEEMEDRQYRDETALGMVEALKGSQKPSCQRPLRAVPAVKDPVAKSTGKANVEQIDGGQRDSTGSTAPQLPVVEERLPWDTDDIRAMFGM
jgi:hypothetical protein